MPERKRWLNPEEWAQFENFFDAVEGTSYEDVRQLALDIVSEKNPELAQAMRENRENISDILMVGLLAKRTKEAA